MKKPFKEWSGRFEMVQRGEHKSLLIAQDMTIREFLRAGLGLATAASGIGLIAGRAAAELHRLGSLIYSER